MTATTHSNKALVEAFWRELYVTRDYVKLATYFTDDAWYRDVPTPDNGAIGPQQIIKRIKIGHEPVERFDHVLLNMVCDGDVVITEHHEVWHFHTGESVTLPFCSVQEIAGGKIKVWRDYWNLDTLLSNAPKWWVEHILSFKPEDFGST